MKKNNKFNIYLLNLYILIHELLNLNEYKNVKKVILVCDKQKAFIINLALKPKGIKVTYLKEKDYLVFIKKMIIKHLKSKKEIKYLIAGNAKNAINAIKRSRIIADNYIILPIDKEE